MGFLGVVVDWWQSLPTGDRPTWLAAIFAGAAFAFTGRTLWVSEADRRRREQRELSEQARYVRVSQVVQVGQANVRDGRVTIPLEFTVNNESPDVIHDLHVKFEVLPRDVVVEDDGELDIKRDVFASGHQETFKPAPTVRWLGETIAGFSAMPTVEFTDIEGRRWRRDRDYRLTQIPKPK